MTELERYLSGLTVSQGRAAGERFTVLPWQSRFVRGAFAEGVQSAAMSLARGNGKTTLVAGIGAAALDGPLAVPRGETVIVAGYDLLHRVASTVHSAVLTEANGAQLPGERLPIASVTGLGVITDSALDLANLWVAEIAVTVELPLELLTDQDCYGPLDDFLTIRGDIDLPAPAADVPRAVDLPQ